jgi:hypothetical protein
MAQLQKRFAETVAEIRRQKTAPMQKQMQIELQKWFAEMKSDAIAEIICRNECRDGRKRSQNYMLLYQNSTYLIRQGTIKCGEKKNGRFAEITCRNQGTEKSADAEIGAESRADVCAVICADARAVVGAELCAEKWQRCRNELQKPQNFDNGR